MSLYEKRVVYTMPGMDDLTVRRELPFGDGLSMDVYAGERTAGAVVIVAGYPDPGFAKFLGGPFKDMGSSVSWARLIAASGMTAITYTNREPVADLAALLRHVREHASELGLDGQRIGVWASSGNVPLALSILPDSIRCAALFYGLTLDLDGSTAIADAAKQFGFANPGAELPVDVPLFLVRAGQDQMPGLNDALDRFVAEALRRNAPLTLVNHPAAPHAFDLVEESEASRGIVRQALAFLQAHLA